MNYKFLFPTFLNRFDFVELALKNSPDAIGSLLHIGTGEGDYDKMIASYCERLVSCDWNEDDLIYARNRNSQLANVEYVLADSLSLPFNAGSFDWIIAVEVIEHVLDPKRMLEQMFYVLKPGGISVLTFPNLNFPFTYDPINRFLSWFSGRHLSIGAYSFGHDKLVGYTEFSKWATEVGFQIIKVEPLSGYLVGLLEAYWTGVVQRLFKFNPSNRKTNSERGVLASRPGDQLPGVINVVRTFTSLDRRFFIKKDWSVGQGIILYKENANL